MSIIPLESLPEHEREATRTPTPTKAVLSSGDMVASTPEAWATELTWRANYTGETELKHAIDEILRLQAVAIQQRDIITALQAEPGA